MKSWIKGGLIGGVVGILISIIEILRSSQGKLTLMYNLSILKTCEFLGGVNNASPEGGIVCVGIIPLAFVILSFILGALIDFLVGKFRKKK